MVFYSFFFVSGDDGLSALQLLPVLGAGLIILNKDGSGVIKAILASPFLVYIGKISYSLYLWHWPIIVLGKPYFQAQGLELPVLPVLFGTFAVSILSYYMIEKTTRNMKHIIPYTLIYPTSNDVHMSNVCDGPF